MKIWPQIQAKMALTQFSPIAGYYHGVLAATVLAVAPMKLKFKPQKLWPAN